MKRKLAVIVLFVYSVVTCKAMAQTVALDYYFNHEVHNTKVGKAERFHINGRLPVGLIMIKPRSILPSTSCLSSK
ncbi:hypothetical protein IDJ77_02885 [Mucilaginibacter sp. ZT4R22]|uniref:Uncharacterized protein n=1 Tax=Mucilaginibacter pankratovii TaxID=2772110 RepID=A0ABR7WK90_9SPHI|nr:hypothetical protein [Mucilaginibacter pankratovii]MBD1362745.1 hypothetical protein [Mucilaginibacter pankratovii]